MSISDSTNLNSSGGTDHTRLIPPKASNSKRVGFKNRISAQVESTDLSSTTSVVTYFIVDLICAGQ